MRGPSGRGKSADPGAQRATQLEAVTSQSRGIRQRWLSLPSMLCHARQGPVLCQVVLWFETT